MIYQGFRSGSYGDVCDRVTEVLAVDGLRWRVS